MTMIDRDTAWMAVAAGAAALAGIAVRQGLDRTWRLVKDEDPPRDPTAWDVDWKDAIAWTVASGVVVGLGRLLARRGAAAGWYRVTGDRPPL